VSIDQSSDPLVSEIRARISATDREILAAVNRRLTLVARLHAYKAERGYAIVDRAREEAVLASLCAENPGPLSAAGVRDVFQALISIVTREAAALRQQAPTSSPRNPPG